MIYLIKSGGVDDRFLLKIGYAKDVDKRLLGYRTHNPEIELLDTREGDKELETLLHNYFSDFSYPGQPEWFYYNSKIIKEFQLDKDSIKKVVNSKEIIKRNYNKSAKTIICLSSLFISKYSPETFESEFSTDSIYRVFNEITNILPQRGSLKEESIKVIEETSKILKKSLEKSEKILSNLRDTELLKESGITFKDSGYYLTSELIIDKDGFQEDMRLLERLKNWVTTEDDFLILFSNTSCFETRMKLYCEFVEENSIEDIKKLSFIPDKFHTYYEKVGPKKLKALGYREKDTRSYFKLLELESDGTIKNELSKYLKVGDRKLNTELKSILGTVYKSLGITENPKASDIKKYFNARRTRLRGIEGLEILL